MKLNKFLWSLSALAALGLASCSSDKLADEPIDPNEISDGTVRYMALSISNNNAGSRADEVYEESTTDDANERVIKTIRVYFFDADGKAAACKSGNPTSTNYYDVLTADIVQDASAMDNIDMNYKAVVVISTAAGDTRPAQMVALVNVPDGDYPTLITGTSTLADLEKIVSSYAYTSQLEASGSDLTGAGLAMASSVYKSGTAKTFAASVPVALYTTADQAKANPVEVYVERVNAKVRMKLGTGFTGTPAKSTVSADENDITVYNVKNNSTENANVTVNIGDETKDIVVKFGGWYVTAEMPQSFLIKHINGTWEDGLFTDWNKAEWHRSFWAINPSSAEDPREDGNMRSLSYKTYNATGSTLTRDANYVYVQENAADKLDGTKVTQWAASPAGLTKNDNHCTKVLVKGTLGYVDGGVFKALDYAEWAGQKYVVAGNNLETAMLASLNYWVIDNTATGPGSQIIESTTYRKLSPDDVKIVTASGSDLTTHVTVANNVAQEKRYKCHLELETPANWNTVYQINGEGASATATEINVTGKTDSQVVNEALAAGAGDIKYWNGGQTYYFFDIKHLAAGATEKIDAAGSSAAGHFGVVRNHVYDCTVNGVFGLGTPVYDPAEVIIPENVTEEESFVAIQLKVLSWRVVSQSVNLGE